MEWEMKFEELSPETQLYIRRIHLYDGAVILAAIMGTLSTWGIIGLVIGIPISIYALIVGYLCRQHAYCEDERIPYIWVWMVSLFFIIMLTKAGGAIDKLTKGN